MTGGADVEVWPAVSGLARTVVRGTRREVFRALGEEHREEIHSVREGDAASWGHLVERAGGRGAPRFRAVRAASRERLPVESAELAWLAQGAGLPEDDVWALNLRGDLGSDGTGCSDVAALLGGHPLAAHNEDGGSAMAGRIRLVTLDIDGDPAVTALWSPGMLPSNAFVVSAVGLGFGMDHLPVVDARRDGAGRHLVARHAQRAATGADAVRRLVEVPCAGGFAFTVADVEGASVTLVENVAGAVASRGLERDGAPHTSNDAAPEWLTHTNHARLVPAHRRREPPADEEWLVESHTRWARLQAALVGAPPSSEGVLAALRSPGVCNRSEDLWTYATALVDGGRRTVTLVGGGEPWTCDLARFATGRWTDPTPATGAPAPGESVGARAQPAPSAGTGGREIHP